MTAEQTIAIVSALHEIDKDLVLIAYFVFALFVATLIVAGISRSRP